ncbi:hypothetical protein ES703_90529 [subsurface metagenome]
MSHALSFRPALKLIYETLTLELFGLYNFTTVELLLRPRASYDMADALTVTLGGDFITGPDDTTYGIMDSALSSVFVQLRASF